MLSTSSVFLCTIFCDVATQYVVTQITGPLGQMPLKNSTVPQNLMTKALAMLADFETICMKYIRQQKFSHDKIRNLMFLFGMSQYSYFEQLGPKHKDVKDRKRPCVVCTWGYG